MYSQIVERAELFPHACIICKSANTGPFWDTAVEDSNGLRVYLCRNHVREGARMFGFSPGKKLSELANAAERIGEVEKERDAEKERRASAEFELQLTKANLAGMAEHAEFLRGRVAQLELAVTEEARAKLALVGGDAA